MPVEKAQVICHTDGSNDPSVLWEESPHDYIVVCKGGSLLVTMDRWRTYIVALPGISPELRAAVAAFSNREETDWSEEPRTFAHKLARAVEQV